MKVKAIRDFDAILNGIKLQVKIGAEFDLPRYPKATEWLAAGLVIPVREINIETAVRTPQERQVIR